MTKEERLQLRMHPDLKTWFKRSAHPRGGMSKVVHEHVEGLYEKETGRPWTGDEECDGASTQADGADHGGEDSPP